MQFSPEKYREKYHDILHQSKYRENIACIEKNSIAQGCKGTPPLSNYVVFWKSSIWGGGGNFRSKKNHSRIFDIKTIYLGNKFPKKN